MKDDYPEFAKYAKLVFVTIVRYASEQENFILTADHGRQLENAFVFLDEQSTNLLMKISNDYNYDWWIRNDTGRWEKSTMNSATNLSKNGYKIYEKLENQEITFIAIKDIKKILYKKKKVLVMKTKRELNKLHKCAADQFRKE